VLRVEAVRPRARRRPPKGSADASCSVIAGASPVVFEDRTVSPTYVLDAARATRQLLELQAPGGLDHCVNDGTCTWLEFAQVCGLLGVNRK